MFDFSALAAAAVANNNKAATAATPAYALSLDEARKVVKVRDGNRKPAEDGTKALTLVLGKITLDLEVIAPGATRVNATPEQEEAFTAQLLAAVEAGAFDNAILTAQFKGDPANRKAKAARVAPIADEDVDVVPEGVVFEDEELV